MKTQLNKILLKFKDEATNIIEYDGDTLIKLDYGQDVGEVVDEPELYYFYAHTMLDGGGYILRIAKKD